MRWFHTLLVRLRFNQFLTNHSPEDSTRGLRRQVELCSRARGKSRLMTEPVLYCAEPSGSHIFEGLVHLPILEFDRFQRIRIRPWPIPKNSTCGSGELRKWGWFSRCGGTLCLPCSVLFSTSFYYSIWYTREPTEIAYVFFTLSFWWLVRFVLSFDLFIYFKNIIYFIMIRFII
jgi:hypothetical protein